MDHGGERKQYRAHTHPPDHALLPRGPPDRFPGRDRKYRLWSRHVRSLSLTREHVSQEVPYLVSRKSLRSMADHVTCPSVGVALHTVLAAGQPKSTLVEYCHMTDDSDTAAKLASSRLEGLLLA